jgi:uncharacterized protein (TIGR02118 family)
MHKLIAIYDRPDDPEAFMDHYLSVHIPLVMLLPGLLKAEVNKVETKLVGEGEGPFLIAEMTFADKAHYDAAMASPENRAAGKDLMSFARGKVTLVETATV